MNKTSLVSKLFLSASMVVLPFAVQVSPVDAANLVTTQPFYGEVLADSVQEFSGVQGQNNWYYGYYNDPFDYSDPSIPAPFNPIFQQMQSWTYNAPGWNHSYWWSGTAQNTYLWSIGGFPNAWIGWGPKQWAVRRWISEVDGEISITGNLSKLEFGGDGSQGLIIVNGKIIWNRIVGPFDSIGSNYEVNVKVSKGATVDFVVDSVGHEIRDLTQFTALISRKDVQTVPEPGVLLSLVTIGIGTVAMKRKLSA